MLAISLIIYINLFIMNGFLKVALVISAMTIPVIFFWEDLQTVFGNKAPMAVADMNGGDGKKKDKGKKDKNKEEANTVATSGSVQVQQRWELPAALKEISGIAYLNATQFACVEDESGKIYIYNTASQKVDKEISFAGPGDYEGIAVAGTTAYVMQADGKLYEVANYMNSNKPAVKAYNTGLTVKQDVEGLAYDKKNNRLLLAIKGNEPNTDDYKGIYAFDLSSKTMAAAPAYKIDLTHSIWGEGKGKGKKSKKVIQPSDLEVHPTTGDIYIVDGPNPKLLVLDASGTPKHILGLSKSDFEQPEGLAFTPAGELYISSEGGKGAGIIAKVAVSNP
jgi:uncharacterized protein YjiK